MIGDWSIAPKFCTDISVNMRASAGRLSWRLTNHTARTGRKAGVLVGPYNFDFFLLRECNYWTNVALQKEYLLSGMEGLLVFVTSEGVSNRPPIVRANDEGITVELRSSAIFHPYIITMDDLAIRIYR